MTRQMVELTTILAGRALFLETLPGDSPQNLALTADGALRVMAEGWPEKDRALDLVDATELKQLREDRDALVVAQAKIADQAATIVRLTAQVNKLQNPPPNPGPAVPPVRPTR